MIKIGSLEFHEDILRALQNDTLVVFAGAGVSMGSPSYLPSFERLAADIANGTGHVASQPLDRFLGQLHHRKIPVHSRAAQLLAKSDSRPTALHENITSLFGDADRVRIVTTNFDLHFETAADSIFGRVPDVYRAPALPLGYRFSGIVHVHGALTHPDTIVLTDADFGRAYLTEGWARRFLVDVFRRYTVLFVGYSHDDVVMNYLSRALPVDGIVGRYALTDSEEKWELLGISPILFKTNAGTAPYSELNDGMEKLAARTKRSVLDWQARLAEIAARIPPADEESVGEIEQALQDLHTTRFFTKVARDEAWLKWLSARKKLTSLFQTATLTELEIELVYWIARHYAVDHASAVFGTLAENGNRLNPTSWRILGREIALSEKQISKEAFKRWVTVLLQTFPNTGDFYIFEWLAQKSSKLGCLDQTLRIFLKMCDYQLTLKSRESWFEDHDNPDRTSLDIDCTFNSEHSNLEHVWVKCLKPEFGAIATPLLSNISRVLVNIHEDLITWSKADDKWDPISYHRSAIELHEQDQFPEPIDVLIDVARDSLEWLAAHSPALLETWIELLISSNTPLLRRLAIHAVTIDSLKSVDERVEWLLDRVDLDSLAEHHEIHRAVALSYTAAKYSSRQKIISSITALQREASENWTAVDSTARGHFDWLSWLSLAAPDCTLIKGALAPIQAQYPLWMPSDHPDLTHWSGPTSWVEDQSPWTVEQLLGASPSDQLENLLEYQSNGIFGPSRSGLINAVQEACKSDFEWAFALTKPLSDRELWSSDLWREALGGLKDANLDIGGWKRLLALVSQPGLQRVHSREIADIVFSIVRNGGVAFSIDLLDQADEISLSLWSNLEATELNDPPSDWLSSAINRSAGIIVEYWVHALSMRMRGKPSGERVLPKHYQDWFTCLIHDNSINGGLGRSILASQTAFLFNLDKSWTTQYIIPLFSERNDEKFRQAWDGFLVWGRLDRELVAILMPAFSNMFERLKNTELRRRQRFVEFFTGLAVFHVLNPLEAVLQSLFQHGTIEDRVGFTTHVEHFLRSMQPALIRDVCDRWLFRFWENRLDAIPAPLADGEIRAMLDWLPSLGDYYPRGVMLAIRFPMIQIDHSYLLFQLRDSTLATAYPNETAKLLIYFCGCSLTYHVGYLKEVADRLPVLDGNLSKSLQEALARVGAA